MDQQPQISNACLNCPRCNSTNTKFCYYNNYSLSQPRHFCKACKRYWTRGGTLRNVPVGGGCRKNSKRVKSHNVVLPKTLSSLSSVLVDAQLSSSNQVPQIPTSTTIQGVSNEVLITPLLYDRYKEMMIQQQRQQCNIYSDTNFNTNNDDPTDAAFVSNFNNPIVEYYNLHNMATSSSSLDTGNQAGQHLGRLFPFQTMQQQQQQQDQQLTSTITDVHHHNKQGGRHQQLAQRWNSNHDPYNTSMHTTPPWPHNHLANMDG